MTFLFEKIKRTPFTTRLYISIIVFFTIPMIVYSFSRSETRYRGLLEIRTVELTSVAKLLTLELSQSYEDILRQKDKLHASREEKIDILNKELQPVINKFAKSYPNIGTGYYDLGVDSVVAIGPHFKEDLLITVSKDHPYLGYLKTKTMVVGINKTSSTFQGSPILYVAYPIFDGDKLIGHAWANVKTEDIVSVANRVKQANLLMTVVMSAIAFIGAYIITNLSKNALTQLAEQVKDSSNIDSPGIQIFPELNPLIEELLKARDNILRRELEKERFSTIAQLAAGLAHDIRNPLTSIRGFLQLIDQNKKEDNKEFINIAIEELDSINRLITDMLYLAKPPKSFLAEVDVKSLIHKITNLMTPEAHLKEITVQFSADESLPILKIDQEQVKQVLINLVKNSFDAVSIGGVVKITACRVENNICISVRDNGKGIKPEELDRVFDPLYTTKNTGSGLGLSICRDIILRHDGKIKIESKAYEGTVVKIYLPIKEV